jgi:putative copper resistance protein D
LFAAAFFVGGSYFFWLVIIPASRLITNDESERTQMVGKIAKVFGKTVTPTLIIIILTGIYNASWYVASVQDLLIYPGTILLTKIALVIILLVLIYVHNVYFGKRITALAKERNVEALRRIRKTSRRISAANLILMVVILFLAVVMQMPP